MVIKHKEEQVEPVCNSTRRRFIQTASAGAALLAIAGPEGAVAQPTTAKEVKGKSGATHKVIDWRCRPPLKPYAGLFNL